MRPYYIVAGPNYSGQIETTSIKFSMHDRAVLVSPLA
jgi:hypothetical protein